MTGQAILLGCPFFDAGPVVTTSDIDGVHWEPDQHVRFAQALAKEIRVLTGS